MFPLLSLSVHNLLPVSPCIHPFNPPTHSPSRTCIHLSTFVHTCVDAHEQNTYHLKYRANVVQPCARGPLDHRAGMLGDLPAGRMPVDTHTWDALLVSLWRVLVTLYKV